MSQLLSYVFSVSALTLMVGPSLRGEEPRSPTPQTDSLPAGAVVRFGTSRFLNYGRVFSVAFSPDGKTLAAGSWDGVVRLWEVAGGKELRQLDKQQAPVRALAFSPDGKMLACGGDGSKIVLWDAATRNELRRLVGHRGPIGLLMFSPDGKLLASKADDQTLRLWDVAAGREVRRFGNEKDSSQVIDSESPVAFSPDGKTVASARLVPTDNYNYQRSFRSWNVATGTEVQSFKVNRASFGAVAFSPNGKLLAVATDGAGGLRQRIGLWDVDSGKELHPIEQIQAESPEPVSFLTFSPDGKTLASGGAGPIQLWEAATRREACRFQTHDNGRTPLAFSPDGRLLASGSTDITVLLWDVTGRRQGGRLRPAELSLHEFQSHWADLESSDVPKARRALWTMTAAGGPSVDFLRERLHPAVSAVSAETIARLVADLDNSQFSVRNKAMAQLVQLAELAEPALRDAQQHHPSLELRQRIEQVLSNVVDQRSRPSGERLRGFRAVEILEQIGTPEARQLLETLSRGASGALLTQEAKASLERLGRQAVAHP